MFKRLILLSSLLSALFCPLALAGDLLIVRHGNSDHNVRGIYNSNPAHPKYQESHLTEVGVEQAAATAKELLSQGYHNGNIAKVVVSPLPRTQETARTLAKNGLFSGDKIVLDTRLIEMHAGDRESLPYAMFQDDAWEPNDAHSYHGESNADVRVRVQSLYNETLAEFADSKQHILYVSHGSPSVELIDIVSSERIRLKTAGNKVLPLKRPA